MSDMFEYLEAQAQEENLPFRNAAVVAIDRVERRFGSFVGSAQGEKEFNSRLELVKDQIEKIAADVCEEFGYDDPAHIAKLALGQIEMLAARPEPEGRADNTQKLKSQKPEGYYTEPSPKLNPGSAGDHIKNTNPPIPELEPDDKQHPTDFEWPWNSDIPMEGDGLKRVDVTKQKREQVGPNTQTFPDKNQANPVTSANREDMVGYDSVGSPVYREEDAVYDINSDMDEPGVWQLELERKGLISPEEAADNRRREEALNAEYEKRMRGDYDPNTDPEMLALEEQYPIIGYNIDSTDPSEDELEYMQEDMASGDDINRGETRDQMDAVRNRRRNHDSDKSWKNYRPDQYKSMAKAAAERMDFNALSEIMTPSDAIGKLVEAGMPEHEAKDRIDFYVNHVDPGWAHKSWTSANKESMWDQTNPDFMNMSYDVDSPTVESIRQVYQQHSNSESFKENPQLAADTLFKMYGERVNTPEQVETIANMMKEAVGIMPSNVEEVVSDVMRFASTKTADHPGVYNDQIKMIEGVLERGMGRGGRPLNARDRKQLQQQLKDLKAQESEAAAEYHTPGMNIDPAEERRIKKEMPERIDNPMDDYESPSSPTKNTPVNYTMTSSYYQTFLKKQTEK
jgi:hypothetical protein